MYVHLLQQKDHGFGGSPSFLTIKQIKHLKTAKSFIPQRIQNHFSCFAPSRGSVFPLNSSTCSTANSPFVSVPVLSKPAERIKGLRFFQCSDYRFFCHDSFLLKKVICLKQPKFNALLVFTCCIEKNTMFFSWQNRSFHWTVNGPSKIAKPTARNMILPFESGLRPAQSLLLGAPKGFLTLHICDCRWLYAADYCDKFYWLQSSSPVVKTCNWTEILICAFADLCSEFGYFSKRFWNHPQNKRKSLLWWKSLSLELKVSECPKEMNILSSTSVPRPFFDPRWISLTLAPMWSNKWARRWAMQSWKLDIGTLVQLHHFGEKIEQIEKKSRSSWSINVPKI